MPPNWKKPYSVKYVAPSTGTYIGGASGGGWVSDFNLPDGTPPSVVLDFVNGRYFDGSSNAAALSSLVSGGPTIDANGMLCNSTSILGIGALLTAVQAPALTIRAETYGGAQYAASALAIVGMQSPNNLALIADNTNNKLLTWNGSGLYCAPELHWPEAVFSVTAWDASGRDVVANAIAAAFDSGVMTTATFVTLGSAWGASAFGGYLRTLAIYPVRAPRSLLRRIAWPLPFLTPLTGSHCVVLPYVDGSASLSYISPGAKLIFERTQAWTCIANISMVGKPVQPSVIFTNVVASPWYGYEVWVDKNGHLKLHLLSAWLVGGGGQMCAKVGSINVADGRWHTIAGTYDGSSTAAGIKLYVDGVLDTGTSVEQDNLAGTIVNGTPDFWIGNQINCPGFQIGAIDSFVMSNIVRSASYIAANVGAIPAVDANTVISYSFEEGTGATTADGSANAFTATLFNNALWL